MLFGICQGAEKPIDLPVVSDQETKARVQYFSHQDGLMDGVIRVIHTAKDGSIWFGGKKGLSRYDGVNWTHFDSKAFPNISIGCNAIISDRTGKIWVGTNGGVARYDGQSWTTYTMDQGLPGKTAKAIYETQDGHIWVGFGKFYWQNYTVLSGLAKWDGKQWHRFTTQDGLVHNDVNDIYQSKDGLLWVATDAGVSSFDGQNWQSYTTSDGLLNNTVQSIFQDATGAMWFGTGVEQDDIHGEGAGVTKWKDGTWTSYKLNSARWGVRSLYQSSDGVLWAYTGAELYQYENTKWTRSVIPFDNKEYAKMHWTKNDILWLPGVRVTRYDYGTQTRASYQDLAGPPYEDKGGTLWFNHAQKGILKFDGHSWRTVSGIRWPIFRAKNNTLWAGGIQGIRSSVDEEKWQNHAGMIDNLRNIVQDKDGNLWFVGDRKERSVVTRFDGKTWQVFGDNNWREKLTLGRKVVEAPNGDMWFVPTVTDNDATSGIVQFTKKGWIHHIWQTQAESNRVFDVTVSPQGVVWAGTDNGLWTFDGNTWQEIEHAKREKIVKLHISKDGSLWCASALNKDAPSGLLRRYPNGEWTRYNAQDGLSGNDIWDIFESESGVLWFGTEMGVSRYNGRSWITYNKSDGLLENAVRYIFQDQRGTLWFGRGHLYERNWWTTRLQPDDHPPETHITFQPGETLATGNLIVEWQGQDPWKITPAEHLQYAYQIDNEPWSDFSPDTRRPFFNLGSGTHTFSVQSIDRHGNTDLTPATYTFYVMPPIWQQPWFVLTLSILLGAFGIQTKRVIQRDRILRKTNEELEHRVEERTEELVQTNEALKQQIFDRERAEAEKEQLEDQLRQTQKMDAIGRLAGGVAHDFNNILSIILGYDEILLSQTPKDAPAYTRLKAIQDASLRAADLVNQLLAFSRKQIIQPKVIDLNAVVSDLHRMLGRLIDDSISLTTMAKTASCHIMADRGQMEQVLLNLVVNARDAMPQGGTLTIQTDVVTLSADQIQDPQNLTPGRYVKLTVTDTGIGMDTETQEQIFEPFFTTKAIGEGTGLGLSTVYGIVRQANGHVMVTSTPNEGTTFEICLPEIDAEVDADYRETAVLYGGQETILLVEDESAVRELASMMLTNKGYQVIEAQGSNEALELYETYKGKIHLLITDVVMAEKSGRELAEALLAQDPDLKVLYMSGYTQDIIAQHGILEQDINYLPKPLRSVALLNKVRAVLDG